MTALLRLAALASPLLLGATTQKPALRAVESIPMYVSNRRILVMLRVGDNPPAPVVFDTGTSGNLLDLAYAKRLGLAQTGPSRSVDGTTGLPVKGFETVVKGARLGGVPVAEAPATVFEYGMGDEVGIFGPYNFPGRLVTLDFDACQIRVEAKSPATTPKGPGVAYDHDGLPELEIDLAGTKVKASLDSGNDAPLLLPLSLAARLPLRGPLVEKGTAVSAAGSQPVYRARLRGKIRIASVEIENAEILFVKGGVPNVGLPVMRQLRLTFDPTGGRTWVRGATPRRKL